MGALTGIGAFVATLATGMLGQQLYDAVPWLTRRCLRTAVARLKGDLRERYEEEWAAHAEECLGNVGKLGFALGCIVASFRIEPPVLVTNGHRLTFLFLAEKIGFWALDRRGQLLERKANGLSRDEIRENSELYREFEKFLDMNVQLQIIRIYRKRIWTTVRGRKED